MTKRTSILSKIYLAVTVLLAIAASALRVYMMQNSFDPENGFYTNDALHNIFGYSLAAVVILVAVIAYIYIKEEKCSVLPREGALLKWTSLLAGCALCGFIVYAFAKAAIPGMGDISIADLAMMALSAVAMLYFFTQGKKAGFRSLLCVSSALVLLTIVLSLYFNRAVSYVDHSVVLCFAASIFSALTFTAEANFALGRSAYKRYLAYAPSAIILSFALSVPDIIYFISHRFTVISDIYYDIIILALGLYQLARLTEIALNKEEK